MPFTPGLRAVGFTQSKRRYPAFIEGLTLPVNGGTGAVRWSENQYGQDLGLNVTSVDMKARDSDDLGTPFPVATKTRNVVVRIRHNTSGPLGNWTLRLFRNDIEVATFSVGMT